MQEMILSTKMVVFEPLKELREDVSAFLDSYFEVSALNYKDDESEEYVGYVAGNFDEARLLDAARAANIQLPKYKIENLEDKDWLKLTAVQFNPFETSDFCIYGFHEEKVPQTKKIPIKVYAATAFGSTHQTTCLCLDAISDLSKMMFTPHQILDVGTGSGILSIACAQKWKKDNVRITAVDIDGESVRVAKQNAFENGLEGLINVARSNGFKAKIVKENKPYQLIVANILARPLIDMAKDFASHTTSNGYVVLSGFTDEQEGWVLGAFEKKGFKCLKVYEKENWRAAVLQKGQSLKSLQTTLRADEAFFVLKNNMFLDEDVLEPENKISELSGFSGSAGTLVVGKQKSWLLVDGRYTLQAKYEVFENIEVVECTNTIEALAHIYTAGKLKKLMLHPLAVSAKFWSCLKQKGINLQADFSVPMSTLIPANYVFNHALKWAGISSTQKCAALSKSFPKGFDALLICSPQALSWLANKRAKDLPCSPVWRAFGLLKKNGRLKIYETFQINLLMRALKKCGKVLANFETTPLFLHQSLNNLEDVGFRALENMKLQKNKTEIEGFKNAHIRDGVAMVRFIRWLEQNYKNSSELDVAEKLDALRKRAKNYFSKSFETIAGVNQNAAIVHYKPCKKTNKKMSKNALLLVDSGAQYYDGTTDITRTFALGAFKEEMKHAFTRVLKAHIALASAEFEEKTPACCLDKICRDVLKKSGQDYAHGTGHSVGHFSDVHEPPFAINKTNQTPVLQNYVTSIEPGVYNKGAFGVRIENLYYTVPSAHEGKLIFEPLTLCPIDLKPIKAALLTAKEKTWLNAYHDKVFKCLSPYLKKDERLWLKGVCKPI